MPLFDLGITIKEELIILIKEDLVEKFDIIFKEECENIETWKNCKYSLIERRGESNFIYRF